MIYVISDTPKLKKSFINNTSCFELRALLRRQKKMVVISDNRLLLEYVKDPTDNFVTTTIEPGLLQKYCQTHNVGLLHVSKCYCDIRSKTEVCKMDEYALDGRGGLVMVPDNW